MDITEAELLRSMRDYYDGFSFDGTTRLYNPFSVLQFFDKDDFRNFWFDSGSPSFLVNYAKKIDLEVESFRGIRVDETFTSVTEIEAASPESFLFQSGYLTVREKRGNLLCLDYPNKEVLSSIAHLFLYGRLGNPRSGVIRTELEMALAAGRAEDLVVHYNRVLAAVPYDLYVREERKYEAEHEKGDLSCSNLAESFFHAMLFVLLWASRLTTRAENHSYKGRSDVEVECRGKVYIVELKIAEGRDACEHAVESALRQIETKGYADRYDPATVTLIGLAVDRTERQVGAFRIVPASK